MLPERIPYKFNMTAVVRGSHKVQAVTSTGDCLKVETNSDHSTTVNIVKSNFVLLIVPRRYFCGCSFCFMSWCLKFCVLLCCWRLMCVFIVLVKLR